MKKLVLLITIAALCYVPATAQKLQMPLVGAKAPSFTAESTNGKLTFPGDFGKSWKILFSHPQDFTPVCSSELLELAYMQKDFEKLRVKIAVISTNDLDMHKMWKAHLEELNYKGRGPQKIDFPLFDDHTITASKKYGMLQESASTDKDVRGVFIIDPNNIVRAINFYPMQVGRNMLEIERIVEALQTADRLSVLTPANWNVGDDVLISHFPYTDLQLATDPEIQSEFYNVGNRLWFKKAERNNSR